MSDSVLLPVPTTSPPHVTDRSYRTAIRIRAAKLPRRSGVAVAALGPGRARRRLGPEVAIDHRADVDQLARAAERRDDRLGVGARGRRRRPVRHQHREQALGPDRLGDEVRDDRRIDPARQAEHGALEAGLLELAADELADDPARDVGVDRQLGRQLEGRTGRRSVRSRSSRRGPGWADAAARCAPTLGGCLARRACGRASGGAGAAPCRGPRTRSGRRLLGRHEVEAGLRPVLGGRCRSPGPPARRRSGSARGPGARAARRAGAGARSARAGCRRSGCPPCTAPRRRAAR